jgi:hypothetical protein
VFGLQCKCIEPKNKGAKPACALPQYKGDGNCDDENNNKGCGYDGGDCCVTSVKGGKVKKDYCKAVGFVTDGCDFAFVCFAFCVCVCASVCVFVCLFLCPTCVVCCDCA